MKVENNTNLALQEQQAVRLATQKNKERTDAKIKKIEDSYQQQIEQVKQQNTDRLQKARDREQRGLIQIHDDFVEQVDNLKKSNHETIQLLDQQRSSLINEQKTQTTNEQETFQDRFTQTIDRHRAIVDDLQAQGREQTVEQTLRQEKRLNEIRTKGKLESAKLDQQTRHQLANNKLEFDNSLAQQQTLFEQRKNQQTVEQTIQLDDLRHRFESRMHNITEEQNQLYQQRIQERKSLMEAAESDFQTKFRAQLENHQKILQNLWQELDQEINHEKNNAAIQRQVLNNRLSDPFYHLQTFPYQLTDKEKQYELTFKVPEHEKDFVQVNGKDHQITITFARQMGDAMIDSDGTNVQYKKSESYRKQLQVPQVIHERKIAKEYANGILTFVIPKK